MKLIIMVPCYNEEDSLSITLSHLPRTLPGIDKIEWLVVDDGSTDATRSVAHRCGVDHIVSLPQHQGLGRAFEAGVEASLEAGADIIVNTDADNQYQAQDIPALLAPILRGDADIVIGARSMGDIEHFSFVKKCLQRLGSRVVRTLSGTTVPDATSGFRAMSRKAAMKLHSFGDYTYTIETLIQAGLKGMAVTSVRVATNEDLRPSRLVRSIPDYIRRQMLTTVRIFMTYKPFRFFAIPGALMLTSGLLISLRFVYFFLAGQGTGHIQSVILAALLLGVGFFLIVVGLLADLISVNRRLIEGIDFRIKSLEQELKKNRSR